MRVKIPQKLLFVALLYSAFAYSICAAQDYKKNSNDDISMPPEMEITKEGDVNVMVPKGVRLNKQSTVMLIEDTDVYAARKFSENENRMRDIEKELYAQRNELKNLREMVEKMVPEPEGDK